MQWSILPLHTSSAERMRELKTGKDCPCWGTGQSTHAVDLSFVLAKSFSSGGTLGAALVGGYLEHFSLKKRQDSSKQLTSNRGFKMKVKPRGLAGPGALSSERKSFKWNTECCYTTSPCWEVAQRLVCSTFYPQNNSRIYTPKSTVGNSSP